MPDIVGLGPSGTPWLLLGLAAAVSAGSAWLTVLLLAYPGRAGLMPLKGVLSAHADTFASFAGQHLLAELPAPRRFFEQLGPDRFRREVTHALQAGIDEHVDDMMSRRNERNWDALSGYARNRVYVHVHTQIPYAIDTFVDQIQRDLDVAISPAGLVHRHFTAHPELVSTLFLASFGRRLQTLLPVTALLGVGIGYLGLSLGTSPWAEAFTLAFAALAGSSCLLFSLGGTTGCGGRWAGVLQQRREHFLQALARSTANEALAWPVLAGEFLHGAYAPRVRQIMRREVSGILDATLFKITLQWLLGPAGVYEMKSSALEKAAEVLAAMPISAALRENCRQDIEHALMRAAANTSAERYAQLWKSILRQAWQILPLALAVAGLVAGWIVGWSLSPS